MLLSYVSMPVLDRCGWVVGYVRMPMDDFFKRAKGIAFRDLCAHDENP